MAANLITNARADELLNPQIYPLWVAQSPVLKTHHISLASTYVRVNWVCSGEDFDTPLLSEEAEQAVAYYAEASRSSNLYDSVSSKSAIAAVGTGAVKRETLKVGSLEKTLEYDHGVTVAEISTGNPLKMAEDLFNSIGCTMGTGSAGSVSLVRV